MNAAAANSHVRAEAHAWFARLMAHDCSAADRAAFERWHAADATHAAAYDHLQDLWQLSDELAREDPAIIAAARASRPARPPSILRSWPLLAAAASVLVVVALWFRLTPQQPPAQHYATAPGEQRSLTLDDGTRVVLDTATAIEVRYGARARSLTLQQGRADFRVHKDLQRPFTVQAGAAQVTATGTQFQVRLEHGLGQVTLLEGQVRVAAKSALSATPVTLAPGQRIAIDAAGLLGRAEPLSESELTNAKGWTVGQLVVKEWPLEALVAEMNRYGQPPLRLGDDSLRRLPVSGTFKPTEPESVALALEYGWPVRVERRDDEIVLHRK